jgi:diguanylate cyclase (GGDEF)-like protein/PAS domain S-box-containing protein
MRSHTTSSGPDASALPHDGDGERDGNGGAERADVSPVEPRQPAPSKGQAQAQRDGDDEQERITRLFEMTSDLLATISSDGHFTLLNPAWQQVLGWSNEQLLAQPIAELMHPNDVERTLAPMLAGRTDRTSMESFTNRFRHEDGSWRWLLWSARCDGEIWYAAAKDVTDQMWLERQALSDPLTRLPNRLLLVDRARQALARLHRSNGMVALLFIDLDRFKAVNDNLGHEAGDNLLISIAKRLEELMRDSDTVARLGGDEFVVLAEDIDDEDEALALAERVLNCLEQPFTLGGHEVTVLASVGVSLSHDPEADPDSLLRESDAAMYQAKSAGGRRMLLFDDELRREAREHVAIETRLQEALPQDELQLDYQPILPLAGGRAVGCEALVRWKPTNDDRSAVGRMMPSVFLPRAAESELIVKIGDWVLQAVCAQAAAWHREGITIPISINVSPRELTEHGFAHRVREQLAAHRLPGRALCLEVSEHAVIRDPERVETALKGLKRLGVVIALDNFGAGQSPLSLPRNLPLDMLKLDRTLIQGFERDRDRRAMVAGMIALAHEASLTAVAVGIENQRQLSLARELDCSVGQGFLLRRPDAPKRLRLKEAPVAVTSAPWRPVVRLGSSGPRR